MVPACCAAVLVLSAVLQVVMTQGIDLPEPGFAGGGARSDMPTIAGAMVPAALKTMTVFSPSRTGSAQASEAAASPLGGAVVAGTVAVRGRVHAIVHDTGGVIRRLPIGATFQGARLVSADAEGVTFTANGKSFRVAYGQAATVPSEQATEQEEEQ